jgi:hypothetical protein
LGLFLRSAKIVTAQLTALCAFHLFWNVEFWLCLLGGFLPLGATAYMFYPGFTLWDKTLSFFSHTFVVPAALYGSCRLGAPRTAWLLQTVQTCVVFGLTLLVTNPGENINWLFGMGFLHPATPWQCIVYDLAMILVLPVVVYLPTNRAVTQLVRRCARVGSQPLALRVLPALLVALLASFGISFAVDRRFGIDSRLLQATSSGPSPLERLPASRVSTVVRTIRFCAGEPRHVALVPLDVPFLPRPMGSEGRVHVKAVLRTVPVGAIPAVPQEIVLEGRRSVRGSVVFGFVASDALYLQPISDLHLDDDRFAVHLQIGGHGLSEFVDPRTGRFFAASDQNEILGEGTGGVYVVGALEAVGRTIEARSRFYLVKRRGILFPEDLWFNERDGARTPLLSRPAEPARSLVAFQASPNSAKSSPEIFVADFFGYDVRRVTNRASRFAEFVTPDGSSCGAPSWQDEETLRSCREVAGQLVPVALKVSRLAECELTSCR